MARKVYESNSKREAREARRKAEQKKRTLTWTGAGLIALIVLGGLIYFLTRPTETAQASAMGDFVAAPSRDHIPEGTDPGSYPSDPPAGGHHYPTTYQPGFYDEKTAATLPQKPAGYLVHNLEHGYVIYWYNCQVDPKVSCDDIKNAIQTIVKENNSFKVIGFPWPSLKTPIAMTSWERVMRLNTVDINTMRAFYKANLNKAPENTTE